jgi:ACS family D-galactonate transporter-like MFS transporter
MDEGKRAHLSPYRWWVLTMASLVQFAVFGFSLMCMPALFYEISQKSGFHLNQLLFAWGMVSLAGLIANISAGMLGDRFGPRLVCGLGLIACTIFGASRALSSNFPTFMIVMFLFGCSIPLITANVPKILGMWFPPQQLGLANGISVASAGSGSALALLISGTILSPALGGWQNVLYLWGGLTALLAILWLLSVRDKPMDKAMPLSGTSVSTFAVLLSLLRKRQILILCLIYLLFMGGWFGSTGSIPFLLEKVRGWSAASAHGLISMFAWFFVLGSLVLPAFSDRVGLRRPILSIGFLVCGVSSFLGLFLAALLPASWAIWVLIAIGGLFAGSVSLAFVIPLESSGIGPEIAGTAVGILLTMGCVGGFIFPFLNGLISGPSPGVSAMIYITLLCCVIGFGSAGILAWLLQETGPKLRDDA